MKSQEMARKYEAFTFMDLIKSFSFKTHQSIFVLRNEGCSLKKIAKKLKVY